MTLDAARPAPPPGTVSGRSSLGIGVSGFAAADNLTHLGADVTVLAESANDAQREKAHLLEILGATVRIGAGATATLPDDVRRAWSPRPGVPPTAPLIVAAGRRDVPVWGEVELAWRLRDPEQPGRLAVRHRHQRQDHDRADARLDPPGRRAQPRWPAATSACRSSRR